MKFDKRTIITIVMIAGAVLAVLGVAYGVYVMTSNNETIDVVEAVLTLEVDANSIILGETITLNATCSDPNFNGPVAFTANGNSIGSATATDGTAILSWTPTAAGSYTVVATATHN